VYVSEDSYNYLSKSKLYGNEILVANVGAYAGLFCIMPENKGICTLGPNMFLLRTGRKMMSKFLYYVGQSKSVWEQLKLKSVATAQPKLNKTDVKNVYICIPSLKEQENIVDFLDAKCAEIDALSSDIQAEINVLEEYKKSVITEAVTKGLNRGVAMKDSGIDYVGKIPDNWEIHPVYFYYDERKNKNYALKEQNLLSLSYGKIIQKDINTNGGLLPASFNTYNIVEPGDIIIRPTDLQNDKRSLRTGLVKEHGIITSAYIDLKPRGNGNSKYFHYLLHAFDIMKVFYNMGNGVRQGLNYSEFSKLLVLSPSRKEQEEIVSYLDEKSKFIDEAISAKQEQLDTLSDYKKSLIYEYVTGQREVPTV
jgi:type I restriction enzyme S subunit